MMLLKCYTQYASKFGKLSSGHRTGKGQFLFQSQRKAMPKRKKKEERKKGNAKECSNYLTIALISHASKVMLKILQAPLQQYMNQEVPNVQAGFRTGKGTRDQIANICLDHRKSKKRAKKTSTFALLTVPQPSTVWLKLYACKAACFLCRSSVLDSSCSLSVIFSIS